MNKAGKQMAIGRAAARGEELPGLVTLFSIDLGGETLRCLGGQVAGGQVGFGGAVYAAIPIAAKGFAWSAEGPPAHPQIELSNLTRLFDGPVAADRLRGLTVRRILTLADQLDPPHGGGGGGCFPPEQWVIERVARLDDRTLRLELAAEASLEKRRFPERVMLRDMCQHRYRRWDPARNNFDYAEATCPYVGGRYFDEEGRRVAEPARDQCSLRLGSGCRRRFDGPLPFIGFPGIGGL